MYINCDIFRAHCVYFEIKEEQTAETLTSDYLFIEMVCFSQTFVLIWLKKINK
jgi:hypothetical protein